MTYYIELFIKGSIICGLILVMVIIAYILYKKIKINKVDNKNYYLKINKFSLKFILNKNNIFILFLFYYLLLILYITFAERTKWDILEFKINLNILSLKDFNYIIKNITLFLPFGFILNLCKNDHRYLNNKFCNVIIFIFPLFIELMQLVSFYGIFDIHDIWSRILGSYIGVIISKFFIYIYKKLYKKRKLI